MRIDQLIKELNALGICDISSQLDKSQGHDIVFYNLKSDSKSQENFRQRLKSSKAKKIIVNNKLSNQDDRVIVLDEHSYKNALHSLLDHFYPLPRKKFIAITGTNGKTSCVHHLAQILHQQKNNVLTIGTLGILLNLKQIEDFGLTTPGVCELRKTIFSNKDKYDFCLMEVSSHSLDQDRLYGIDFCAAGWTNLTQDHLDYHHTMEKYFKAKLKIVNYLGKGAKLIVSEKNVFDLIEDKSNILMAKNFDLSTIKKNLQTTFAKKNINLCLSILETLGIRPSSLRELCAPPGRFDSIENHGIIVVVDYAHTPDALENVCLGIRQSYDGHKLTTIFGCGGDRDKTKRPLMGKIAQKLSDQIVITSDNPRGENPKNIIDDILQGINIDSSVSIEPDRKKAIESTLEKARVGDIVLIAGKGHETYQEVNGIRLPFDDLECVKRYWGTHQ